MKSDLTGITLVLDRSGSMEEIRTDAEGGVNTFKKVGRMRTQRRHGAGGQQRVHRGRTEGNGMSINRVFLNWTRPALPAAVDWLIERFSAAGQLDLGGVVLALPGGRAGRRLLEILVAEAERRQLLLCPPRMVTAGKLPELLYPAQRPFADALVQQLAWVAAIRQTDPGSQNWSFQSFPPETTCRRGWHWAKCWAVCTANSRPTRWTSPRLPSVVADWKAFAKPRAGRHSLRSRNTTSANSTDWACGTCRGAVGGN